MYVCNVYMCNVMYNYSKIVSTAFRVSEDAGNVCMYWCPQVTCKSCDLGDSPVESTPISTDIQGTSAYNTHMTFTQTCTLHTCTGTNQVKDSTHMYRHKSSQRYVAPQLQSVKQNLSADFRAYHHTQQVTIITTITEFCRPSRPSGGLLQFSAQKHLDCCLVHCPSNVNQNCTVEPLYKGHSEEEHLSNENTVCSPNHIQLCTNLPLNWGNLSV